MIFDDDDHVDRFHLDEQHSHEQDETMLSSNVSFFRHSLIDPSFHLDLSHCIPESQCVRHG